MIVDEQEYRVTRELADRLVAALAQADQEPPDPDPRHQELMRAALASQLHDLRAELAIYEAGRVEQRAGDVG